MRNLALAAGLVGLFATSVSAQSATLAQLGEQVYSSKECARCHMIAGRGYRHGKLDGVASKMSPDDMRRWLTAPVEMEARLDGRPKVRMSSRKRMKLNDAEVDALVAYLVTLK